MKQKELIIALISFLIPSLYAADPHLNRDKDFESLDYSNQTEETRVLKQLRVEELSLTQRMALYFIHLLRSNSMRLDKTYLHKFIYYANGLYYAVFNRPLLEDFSFEAHQFGPFVHDVQHSIPMLSNTQTIGVNIISDDIKAICDFTFNALKQHSSRELSRFTHEEGTPWTRTRRRAKNFRE